MDRVAGQSRVPALLAFGLGAASVVLTSLGWIPVAVVAIPTVVVAVRAGRLEALGGYLIGFGLVWTLLIVRVIASGATQDDSGAWVAVGVVAIVVGVLLAVVGARRGRDGAVPVG